MDVENVEIEEAIAVAWLKVKRAIGTTFPDSRSEEYCFTGFRAGYYAGCLASEKHDPNKGCPAKSSREEPMSDLSKLMEAPWVVKDGVIADHVGFPVLLVERDDSARDIMALEFCALARNAFDVMMRRGFQPVALWIGMQPRWRVRTKDGYDMDLKFYTLTEHRGEFDDPFTALVEADRWMKEQEAKP